MPWDASKPRDQDLLSDVGNVWRQTKTDLETYLESFIYWDDSASNTSTGVPRLSEDSSKWVTGRGIAAARSAVSSRNRSDLFYVTDDKIVLYMDSSGNSVPLGGKQAVVSMLSLYGTTAGQPGYDANTKVVVCGGSETTTSGNALAANVVFPVTYNGIPHVMVSSGCTDENSESAGSYIVGVDNLKPSGMTLIARYVKSATTLNDLKWYWRSIGTVTI